MKFAVSLLLLAVFCHAAEDRPSRTKQKEDSSKTDKRALLEGNAGLEKRTPVIANALPSASPGIVYADTNQIQEDKLPQQQIYATPLPQLSKISDLLTGQGHHFQAAIASHLFSPVSIYQTRIPGYEVSAPVPAKLAYTEKLIYQPQSAQQYTSQVFKTPQKPANIIRVSYPQPQPEVQYQQLQPQQLQQVNQYQQLQAPQIQPVHQFQQQRQPQFIQIQQYQPQQQQRFVFNQSPFQFQGPTQFSPQPLAYIQQQLPANVQPGIVYAQQEENTQRPVQKESATVQTQQNVAKQPEQNYNAQNQGAVSYASFSVGPLVAQPQQQQPQKYPPQLQLVQYQPQPQIQYQPQQQYQVQQQQNQAQQQQYQLQPQQVQAQQNPQKVEHQYQIQRQPLPQLTQRAIQFQIQPAQQQIHQQIQPQIFQKSEPSQVNSVNVPAKPVSLTSGKEQLTFYRPEPQAYQPQVYQPQELVAPNQFAAQQLVAAPTFPPVQYFGKFAQELFRSYQQQ